MRQANGATIAQVGHWPAVRVGAVPDGGIDEQRGGELDVANREVIALAHGEPADHLAASVGEVHLGDQVRVVPSTSPELTSILVGDRQPMTVSPHARGTSCFAGTGANAGAVAPLTSRNT